MAEVEVNTNEGKGLQTFNIPVDLALLGTSALDLLTSYVPGFEGNLVKIEFLTNTPGTGASASQSISALVNGEAPEGGVLTLLLADTTPTGKVKAATEIVGTNAKNHFYKDQAIDIKVAAGGTAFTAGSGVLILTLQNVQNF